MLICMCIDVQRDEGGLNRYFVRYVKLDFITKDMFGEGKFSSSQIQQV